MPAHLSRLGGSCKSFICRLGGRSLDLLLLPAAHSVTSYSHSGCKLSAWHPFRQIKQGSGHTVWQEALARGSGASWPSILCDGTLLLAERKHQSESHLMADGA